ncbi:hypothetical protein D3C76_1458620 [compost metagenome]
MPFPVPVVIKIAPPRNNHLIQPHSTGSQNQQERLHLRILLMELKRQPQIGFLNVPLRNLLLDLFHLPQTPPNILLQIAFLIAPCQKGVDDHYLLCLGGGFLVTLLQLGLEYLHIKTGQLPDILFPAHRHML